MTFGLLEVVVLGDDREPGIPRMAPDVAILCLSHTEVTDMGGTREEVRQRPDELWRQILVEEKPQRLCRRHSHQTTLPIRREG